MTLRDALNIPASQITDESVYADRRRLLAAFAAVPTLALSGCTQAEPPPPSKTILTPAQAKTGFRTDEELTRYEDATTYNNFYEFGSGKADPSHAKKTLRTKPWHVLVGGGQPAVRPLLQIAEPQRPEGHPPELHHPVADRLEHAPHLALATLAELELDQPTLHKFI